jgi:hypothetical protein
MHRATSDQSLATVRSGPNAVNSFREGARLQLDRIVMQATDGLLTCPWGQF